MVSPSIIIEEENKDRAAQLTTLKTKKLPPPEISHKLCRQMVEEIVDAYTSKWKAERQAGHPGLRAKNSNVSKKLLKALPKHEDYILKTLQNRWLAFERKYEKVMDSQSMSVELQRIYDSLRAAQIVLGIFKDEKVTTKVVKIKNVEPKAILVEKNFKEIDQLETVVSIAGVRECYINFGKLWKGDDSRWLSVKHNFVQRGFMMANELYISLPIFRSEFELGCGNFGTVEFALSKNFHGVALKRLTEKGQMSVDRTVGIRKCIEAVDRQLATLMQSNVLRMTAFQDMCGYMFLYTRLCDYNLDEYLRALKDRTKKDNLGISSDLKAFLIGQLLQGLCTLHITCQPPVVHGNLKPSNVLVDAGGTVKLTDFGVHKVWWVITYLFSLV